MDTQIQGHDEAYERLKADNSKPRGNGMQFPSDTNGRGYAHGQREPHAEGDLVGSDDKLKQDLVGGHANQRHEGVHMVKHVERHHRE